jgi:peroxiredoxin
MCMVELGELEKRHADFDKRNVRIVAISPDNVDDTKKTQEKFSHVTVLSDEDLKMAGAVQVIHKGAGDKGQDTNVATTILVDDKGEVRWVFRSDRFIERISTDALLEEVDKNLSSSSRSPG